MGNLDILTYIPEGSDFAITRGELCAVTGLNDRQVRAAIHEAKIRGFVIINNGCGYFKPDTDQIEDVVALRHYIKAQHAKARHIEASLKEARALLEDCERGRLDD